MVRWNYLVGSYLSPTRCSYQMSSLTPDHTKEGSTSQGAIVIMDKPPTSPKTLSPYGDLSIFPREIRDEIYRQVLPAKYRAFYSDSIVRPALYDTLENFLPRWIASDLCILRLSKAISDEAMSILYLEGTFYFPLGPSDYLHPNAAITNRMMSVHFWFNMPFDDYPDRFCSPEPGPLLWFQGDTITRKSIEIVVNLYRWSGDVTELTRSPLIPSLKKLTGFETVTLGLYTISDQYCPPKGTTKATKKIWSDAEEWEKLYAGFEPLFHILSKELEPSLGCSSAMSELTAGEYGLRMDGKRHIVFHPRSATSKAKRDAANMEKSKSTKGIEQGHEP